MQRMKISVCTYEDGEFEVILKDENDREVTLYGNQVLSAEEFQLVNELAPACVFTRYVRETV